MIVRPCILSLLSVCILFCASGAQCIRPKWSALPTFAPEPPRVLSEDPSARRVMDFVNQNTNRVRSYWTNNASISAPGMPSLRASIALERPLRFRLRAGTRLGGPEVDLGSNQQLFWFWLRRSEPAALYMCRHDQYARSAAWQVMPIPPQWFIEALGLPRFDPQATHLGPFRRADGSLEIRSHLSSPAGQLQRITVIEPRRALVLEQHLFLPDRRLLASAVASKHRYDAEVGVSLPQQVRIAIPALQVAFTIEVHDFVVNQPVGEPQHMWSKPVYPGSDEVDLAQGTPQPPGYAVPAPSGPPTLPPAPEDRGSTWRLF